VLHRVRQSTVKIGFASNFRIRFETTRTTVTNKITITYYLQLWLGQIACLFDHGNHENERHNKLSFGDITGMLFLAVLSCFRSRISVYESSNNYKKK